MRGSVYDNNGYWYVCVRLTGEDCRRKHPPCAPGRDTARRSDRPKEMAVAAANRLLEAATRTQKARPTAVSCENSIHQGNARKNVV